MADEPDAFRKGLSIALRIGIEFVSALIAGGGLGYFADRYFGTAPILMFVGVFLGIAAGFWNLYRVVSRFER